MASSDAQARVLDEIQLKFGEGPCLAAMNNMSTVYVTDVVSSSGNVKLRDVAAAVVASASGDAVLSSHFDE